MNHHRFRVFSPGRVNLLGEHVDYNDGLVLPAAIDRYVYIDFKSSGDNTFHLHAKDLSQECKFSLNNLDQKTTLDGNPLPHWALYPAGVIWNLVRHGLNVPGFEAQFHSNIPIGAGLSSSAAVEVGFAVAAQSLGGWELDRLTLARYCQQAESQYVGVNCGLMDQFACANGVADHAVLLDTRSLNFEPIPLPAYTSIIIADTTVRRSLIASAYNERRHDCETAIAFFRDLDPKVSSLRDVSPDLFLEKANNLPQPVFKHARHVVEEMSRVNQAIKCLNQGKAQEFGRLMFETHASLRDFYEVSTPELDLLVEIAASLDGIIGARLTGAGFGGCTVNLVEEEKSSGFVVELAQRYQKETGLKPIIFITHASRGAFLER